MSKKLNISVLVAARDEYIDQLKCIVVPLLIQGFNSIYQDALKLSNGRQVIWKFQELLKQIPQWNQTILQEESKRIKRKCPYIMDIVTAIFVTNVKILASVRLKGSREDIRVKIPTSDIFIHSIYIEAAHQIFYDPFLFYHKNTNVQQNKHHVREIIESAVDETIRQMLPFDDILQKYLSDALNENAEFGDGESDTSQENISDSDEESINNDDLPSDESESEDEYPDPDKDRVKSFNLDGLKSHFIPDDDDNNEQDCQPCLSDEEPSEPIPHLSALNNNQVPYDNNQPFNQPPPNNNQTFNQPPPNSNQTFNQPPNNNQQFNQPPPNNNQPVNQPVNQPQQPRNSNYSFF